MDGKNSPIFPNQSLRVLQSGVPCRMAPELFLTEMVSLMVALFDCWDIWMDGSFRKNRWWKIFPKPNFIHFKKYDFFHDFKPSIFWGFPLFFGNTHIEISKQILRHHWTWWLPKKMWQLSLSRKILYFATWVGLTFSEKRNCLMLQSTFIHPEFRDRVDRILFQHTNCPVPFLTDHFVMLFCNGTLRPFTRHLYHSSRGLAFHLRAHDQQQPSVKWTFNIPQVPKPLLLARMVKIAHALHHPLCLQKIEWIGGPQKIHKQIEVS